MKKKITLLSIIAALMVIAFSCKLYNLSDFSAAGFTVSGTIYTDDYSGDSYVIGGKSKFSTSPNEYTVTDEVNNQWFLYDENGDELTNGGSREEVFTMPAVTEVIPDATLSVITSDGYISAEGSIPNSFSILPDDSTPIAAVTGGSQFVKPLGTPAGYGAQYFNFSGTAAFLWTVFDAEGNPVPQSGTVNSRTFTPDPFDTVGAYTIKVLVAQGRESAMAEKEILVTNEVPKLGLGFTSYGNENMDVTETEEGIRISGTATFDNGVLITNPFKLSATKTLSFTITGSGDQVDFWIMSDPTSNKASTGTLFPRITLDSSRIQLYADTKGGGNYLETSEVSGVVDFSNEVTITISWDGEKSAWKLSATDGTASGESWFTDSDADFDDGAFKDGAYIMISELMGTGVDFTITEINAQPVELK